MGPLKYDYNKPPVTSTVITLCGFNCRSNVRRGEFEVYKVMQDRGTLACYLDSFSAELVFALTKTDLNSSF